MEETTAYTQRASEIKRDGENRERIEGGKRWRERGEGKGGKERRRGGEEERLCQGANAGLASVLR